ncbi:MAG: PmoA family protein [Saprospiraceae bacterium]|nr:PmoA family protein [Saprospiraceae bacterium]
MSQAIAGSDHRVTLQDDPALQEVEVLIDGKLFTKYIYRDNLEKPVLFPIYTLGNQLVTRGYPFVPVAGERTDHPHHLGLWFNYGDVNGLDFWNNSSAIPEDKKSKYGEIRHQRILRSQAGSGKGLLEVEANWVSSTGQRLLVEKTTFVFSQRGSTRIIDRVSTLSAMEDVLFQDNKEGMLGIRVTRSLELPSEKPEIFTDAYGNPTNVKVLNNAGVSGDYLSSSGVTGGDVWGTRGEWMRLAGTIDGTEVAIAIIDHPKNPGYPTYWHARGYGLFAANTLGQHAFDQSEQLNFALEKGNSTTFSYRILFHDGSELTPGQIENYRAEFIKD